LRLEVNMNDTNTRPEAKDALERIRAAEDEAAAVVRNAREKDGPLLVQSALEAAAKARDELLERAREEAAALKRAALDEAARQADAIRADAENEKARMRERSGPRMAEAVRETERRLAALLEGGSV
jgi:vacuolar-type H+-ATPase subunit H